MLEKNLARLAKSQPAMFHYIKGGALQKPGSRLEMPASPARVDFKQLRSTTLVYLGVDRFLLELVPQLNGEVNVLLVEDDAYRIVSLLSELDHSNVLDTQKVLWITSANDFAAHDLSTFLLGGVQCIEPVNGRVTPLFLQTLRQIKTFYQSLQLAKQRSSMTYLTMITCNRLMLTKLTLQNLMQHRIRPFKLVILDNGSQDGTREWLLEHKDAYPFIERVMLFDCNLGVGRALNNGMLYALSRSNGVGRIDNDVLVQAGWLEKLEKVLSSSLSPYIVGGYLDSDPNIQIQIHRGQKITVNHQLVYLVDGVGGCLNLYQPRLFEEVGFFPEYPLFGVEDGGICKAVREKGYQVAIVDGVKLQHLQDAYPQESEVECAYEAFKNQQRLLADRL